MRSGYINQLSVNSRGLSNNFMKAGVVKNVFAGESRPTSEFMKVLGNTFNQVNTMANAPDAMLKETMANGTYDIHEVMMASAKAELGVSITAQVATKIVQAYDRILQIQV